MRNEIANLAQDAELGAYWVDFVFHTLPRGRFKASIQHSSFKTCGMAEITNEKTAAL